MTGSDGLSEVKEAVVKADAAELESTETEPDAEEITENPNAGDDVGDHGMPEVIGLKLHNI